METNTKNTEKIAFVSPVFNPKLLSNSQGRESLGIVHFKDIEDQTNSEFIGLDIFAIDLDSNTDYIFNVEIISDPISINHFSKIFEPDHQYKTDYSNTVSYKPEIKLNPFPAGRYHVNVSLAKVLDKEDDGSFKGEIISTFQISFLVVSEVHLNGWDTHF